MKLEQRIAAAKAMKAALKGPLDAAQRKAAERQRYRDAGLVQTEVWIRPEHRERLRKYVERLNAS